MPLDATEQLYPGGSVQMIWGPQNMRQDSKEFGGKKPHRGKDGKKGPEAGEIKKRRQQHALYTVLKAFMYSFNKHLPSVRSYSRSLIYKVQ